ncbi:MAG: pyridine nucleotide-disulfide oxidoreductase family protein [Solidesulfovibrio magneticus str. Maddingley MBC34]|uniref:Pyridine nucleotide-disulfide oxidoreductase family protein n=1 Tax=Solidesulfovibrio magneticus str. Maddingley MBC34 TaxID=1206767 RepID=K6GBZ8_9BACT|nr:MAG: pyridine nucleotide-disulfide oxidoreductase family protein [Solidesulfovibrio magneticus str. Maddingley MBC34]
MVRKRLVLAGCGHAHLPVLARLPEFVAAGVEVVCLAPGPTLAYSGMGPGLLTGRYGLADLTFPVAALCEAGGGVFVRGLAVAVDPAARRLTLADGGSLRYDAASFGLGSRVLPDFATDGGPAPVAYPVKPIENLLLARQDILARAAEGERARVLVAGGGPAGFEVAAGVLELLRQCGLPGEDLAVAAPRGLLPGWPARAVRLAEASIRRRGGRIVAARVRGLEAGRAVLADGTAWPCDLVLAATGTRPPGLFAAAGLTSGGPDGGLAVTRRLNHPLYPELFGGGDCIDFTPCPLPRAGVYAVRQGPVLAENLLAFFAGRELAPFCRDGRDFLSLLNCGDGRAILRKGRFVAQGRWAMALKERIDRGFMRSFPLPEPGRAAAHAGVGPPP